MTQNPKPEDSFTHDLNPQPEAGFNYGDLGPDTTQGRPAADYKDLVERLNWLRKDELEQLPIVPEGTRLEQGKTYIDLMDLEKGEFTGMANQIAPHGSKLVAKDAAPYELWNKLLEAGRKK